MTRLSDAVLKALPAEVAIPDYDRAQVKTGVVHLGIGAFHRAHQAVVFDDALKGGDLRWGVLGASLRSPGVRDQLNPQDGLYTLVLRDGTDEHLRVIGAVRGVLVGPEDPAALVDAMADADVHIVTLTVTEKGYRLDPATGDLLLDDADVAADLADIAKPHTAPGFIVAALRVRKAAGLKPFTVISCDNLPHNGKRIRAGVIAMARRIDPSLADWIEAEGAFPQTMIDRIVPATIPDDISRLTARLGVEDQGMVKAEPFTQWVIEDRFAGERPDFSSLGVQLTDAVEPWENAKLRLLNGAHSAIAYLGALSGYEHVHEAVAVPAFHAYIEALWDEAQTTLDPPPGLDIPAYRAALMARFSNAALMHRTRQIAMDGSQKLPQRLLAGAAERLAAGQGIAAMALGVAAWMKWQSGVTESGEAFVVDDPLAARAAELLAGADNDRARVSALLSLSGIFPPALAADGRFAVAVTGAYLSLSRNGAVEAARLAAEQFMSRVLILNPADDVAIALDDIATGDTPDGLDAPARADIATGHKIARHAVEDGGLVRRYGQVIGRAKVAIAAGDHVHVHNLAMAEDGREAEVGADLRPHAPLSGATFNGIVRADGRIGTRNYIGVLTSVNCSATVARRIADAFPDSNLPAGVDGVVAFTHQGGCGGASLSSDVTLLQRTLAGYAKHPNFHSILIVGLGCEANQIPAWLANEGLAAGPHLRTLTIQEAGGTARAIEAGIAVVRELVAEAAKVERQPVSASHLTVGLQCGGSDGWSGVTANPALGAAVDLLVAHGGSAMLSETPEIWGAEHLLLRRAASQDVADRLNARLAWWRDYAERHQMELNNNPSPGNLKGGLTTILEKSLGAVAKSGSTPLNDVIGYAQPLEARGLSFMDSPGYDPCSATGQIASGANLIVFTTGRGSVFGAKPAPSIKVASNAKLANWMDEDMDIDASPVLTGTSLADVGAVIFQKMLDVASGEPSKSEALGVGDNEFVPWQVGAYL